MAPDRTGPSDESLLASWLAGDRPAFDALVDRYQRRVYAICYRYFRNRSDAEDAAQEAFLTLLRRGETFTGASSFGTWMYRVTMNTCNDLTRKRRRRPQSAGVDVDDIGEAAADALAARELRVDLTRALDALDDEHRDAVLLHDVLGVPYADLATRWAMPVGTVKSRIHRAHAQLAAALVELAPGAQGAVATRDSPSKMDVPAAPAEPSQTTEPSTRSAPQNP